ncbi:MAG TPA: ABC transporter substrate-binding protein [Candidatus Acidoferrum sp.]|nr:ABC transporter substrate-binding protein [Candidatus Acidoferrum sp.]
MFRRREFLTSAVAAVSAGATIAPSAAWAAAGRSRGVSVRFNWTMKGEFAPFVVAREKGFYRDAGIDAQLNPGTSGTQAATSVAVGHDDFGFIPSVQVIGGITSQQMPLRAVATVGSYTGMCWASRADVPLTGPRSLEGRRVSISPSSTFFQVWESFAKHFNVDRSKVEVVSADPSARVGLFLGKRVDVMADIFLANDFVILQSKVNEKLNLWRLSQVDFDPLGYLLVTTTGLIQRDPALVKAFTGATLRGVRFTLDHPDEASAIIARAYDNLTAGVYQGQVKQLATLVNAKPVLGRNEPDAWSRSLGILYNAGMIERELDHASYYTNAFV